MSDGEPFDYPHLDIGGPFSWNGTAARRSLHFGAVQRKLLAEAVEPQPR